MVAAAGWRAAATLDALTAKAEALEARLTGGEGLAVIAEELGLGVESEGPMTRSEPSSVLVADVIETLFEAGEGATATGRIPGRIDAVALAQVTAAEAGAETEANTALREQLAAQMDAMAGDDALTLFLAAKQRDVGVSVNQQLIDSLLIGHGGG